MTIRKYLLLLAVAVFAASGDVSLGRGMKAFGAVTTANVSGLFLALLNPWVILGILMLILFFASYLSALSWADLTYVLPATAISYVLMVLMAKFFLHETVTIWRWLGVGLITTGVGFVATGPEATPGAHRHNRTEAGCGSVKPLAEIADVVERSMMSFTLWGGIAAVVIASTVGDILQSRAMKEVGDLELIRRVARFVGSHPPGHHQLPLHDWVGFYGSRVFQPAHHPVLG